MRSVSLCMTSSDAPTIGATSILLITEEIGTRDSRPVFARNLLACGDVSDGHDRH
jgi:hypothetical protein